MKRLAVSAVYVGANLVASLAIIVLIARTTDDDGRTGFFLFQALFFPLTTLLSQSQMLVRFRNVAFGKLGLVTDAVTFAVMLAGLMALGPGLFSCGEAALYAATVPLTCRGTTVTAGVQFEETRAVFALVPVATAVVRLLACVAALPLGPAAAFFAGSLAYLLVPLGVELHRRRARGEPHRGVVSLSDTMTFFAFFVGASFTFQWERMVFARIGQEELIAISGVCMTWMLSPLSAIFATLYRADARAIFLNGVGFRFGVYLRRGGIFLALAICYVAATVVFWEPLNELLFPFFQGPAVWPLLLGAAIILDRLGHLAVFVANSLPIYRGANAVKLTLIGLGVWIVLTLGSGLTLTMIYGLYLALGIAYAFGVLGLIAWFRPAASANVPRG